MTALSSNATEGRRSTWGRACRITRKKDLGFALELGVCMGHEMVDNSNSIVFIVDNVNYMRTMTQTTRQDADRASTLSTFVAFMTLFGSAQQILKKRMEDQAEQGLGPLHLRALCLCLRNPGGTQQQVVQSMGRDKGQIARLVRDLEERHFLVRSPDAHDRRVWRLTVTPEGEEKCQWFTAIEAQLATDMLGGLGAKECVQLEQLLNELRGRINAVAEEE
ncbi:MarR family winged helix-turn-helix transcriptional regulator [Noviherbaspirillum cavernae]|nr:MarR family winged helix-turn-helix transcriptional regulator [Noviherbaspirillum cavernae]